MGSNSKGKPRQVNFRDSLKILSDMQDQKFLQYAQEFTQTLTILTAKVEVLEKIAVERLKVENKNDLLELFFEQMDRMNGIPASDAPAAEGDRVRIRFTQGLSVEEAQSRQSENTVIFLGKKQIHENFDKAVIGLKSGDKFEVVLPSPEAGGKDVFILGELRAVYSMPKAESAVAN